MSNIDFILKQLTFNWSSISADYPAIYYNILASNCGSCPTITNHTTVTCTDVPTNGSTCVFALQTVVCGNTTSNRSVPIRVNIGIVNHTQIACNSGMHNSVYVTSISALATALIISVVVSITVIVIILLRSKAKIKAAIEVQSTINTRKSTYTESMYEDVTGLSCPVGSINTQHNVAYGHKQTPAH